MPQTEILLVDHIEKLGSEGDVVKVRSGFARNYLIPQNKAVPLTHANKKRLDSLKVARAARETEELQKSQEVGSKLSELTVAVAVKTGAGGKLFGSVTALHVLEKLEEKGFKLDKKHLTNFSPVKELGQFPVTLTLHKEVVVEIKLEVVSENPIEEVE